ncbi:hypothetical protein BD779DRAFT_1679674 [Infundibulicybe gibba]|nr:hypothetical protein BD779DRAFT_1679674 [Infundibulicybe gibba]
MDTQASNARLVQIFIALQLTGGFGFAFLIFSSIVSKNTQRHGSWYSFCASWTVFCISYSMLSFAGQQMTTPSYGLCVTQAALVYAAPPLLGSTTSALVLHVLLQVRLAISHSTRSKITTRTAAVMLFVPWLVWSGFFIGILVFGLQHPLLVERSMNGTYCVLVNTALPKLTSSFATFISAVILALEVAVGAILYRYRGHLAGFGQSPVMALRIAVFTMIGIAAMAVSLVYTVTWKRGVEFDILIAVLPLAAVIIFGSQTDILRVWIFWWRDPPHTVDGSGTSSISQTRISAPHSSMLSTLPDHV